MASCGGGRTTTNLNSVRRVASVALAALALGACVDEAERVPVSLVDNAFTPQPLVVPEGASLSVTNVGRVAHDLVVDAAGRGTADLPPGGRQELPLDGIEPGRYRIYCSVPGHIELGMVGELVIE
jgi:plastocyanin